MYPKALFVVDWKLLRVKQKRFSAVEAQEYIVNEKGKAELVINSINNTSIKQKDNCIR